MTIPIFIASSERFASAEWLTGFSILENTRSRVSIYIIRPEWYGMKATGCTGFTNVRYSIPQLCREMGYDFGIYLDVDMLVVGDIAELWEYRRDGEWVCLEDGSNEVSVVCNTLKYPDKRNLHKFKKWKLSNRRQARLIPKTWNSEDCICEDMKLLHFTGLDIQPWFYDHPDEEAVAIYEEYRARYHNRYGSKPDAAGHRVNQRFIAT